MSACIGSLRKGTLEPIDKYKPTFSASYFCLLRPLKVFWGPKEKVFWGPKGKVFWSPKGKVFWGPNGKVF